MSGALAPAVLAGFTGKLPARGDFVAQGLPRAFCEAWDAWLISVIPGSRARLGKAWEAAWADAPPWRFALPPGQCGPEAVVGVMLPSLDRSGRPWPLTIAATLPGLAGVPAPEPAWLDALEEAGLRAMTEDADPAALAALLAPLAAAPPALAPQETEGAWWTQGGPRVAPRRFAAAALPDAEGLAAMLSDATASDDARGCMNTGFRSAVRTDPGTVRSRNEDSFVDRPEIGLWAVADGAGGHAAGDVASALVREELLGIPAGLVASQVLGEVRARLARAHAALLARAASPGGTTSATTVVVLIARGHHFACLWAGDSRLYRLRGGTLSLMTRDHSLVQAMVDAGTLPPEAADGHPKSNIVTRALGVGTLLLEKITERLEPGDRFLLCSDGLSKALPETEIAALLTAQGAEQAPEMLIAAALARQATDNVTAIVVEMAGEGGH